MDPDKVLLALHAGRQTGDRQRGGVRPQQRIGLDDVLDFLEHLVLEVLAFEDRLDDEVDALEVGGVGGRGDAGQQCVGFLLRGLAPLQRLGFELLGVALTLLRGLDRDVLEHDVEPGLRRDVGDAGAHHARAEHTDLVDLDGLDAVGTAPPAVDVLQVQEERLDHVLGGLAGDQMGEVAALDPAGGVEVHLSALDGRVQDGSRCGHRRALELLLQQRRERRQDAGQAGAARGTARHLVTLGVPRLGVAVGIGLDPGLRGGNEFVSTAHQFIDQADLLGLAGLETRALAQHLHEGLLNTEHPHRTRDTTAAGQQSQRHLGEADDRAGHVGDDPVMAREGDLESTAERGTVDGRHDRLAERLELAQVGLDGFDHAEGLTRVLRPQLDHALEITAGEEGLLRAGDHDAGDRILFRDKPFHGVVHGLLVMLVHHVGRTGRVVQRQGDDAVGILVPLDCVLCHGYS